MPHRLVCETGIALKGPSGFLVRERPAAAEVRTYLDGSWNGAGDMAEGSQPSMALFVYPVSLLSDESRPGNSASAGQKRAFVPITNKDEAQPRQN